MLLGTLKAVKSHRVGDTLLRTVRETCWVLLQWEVLAVTCMWWMSWQSSTMGVSIIW